MPKRPSPVEETVPLPDPPLRPVGPFVAAVVRVLNATATPSEFRLNGGSCRIGSAADCDMIIQEPTVSRWHAQLTLVQDGVLVQDLGSRNGTFYLGQRLEKVVLALGAQVQLGAAVVSVDADTQALAAALDYRSDTYRDLIGPSSAMRRLFAMLQRLESSLTTVLVQGEAGAGKNEVARAVHEGSPVASGPMVTLTCGALPSDVVASELFGSKGTGGAEARKGAFEAADGGTLFLDEVAELPLEVQPMLLRAIETGDVRALGGDATQRVKVRVIAATHRDLGEEVRAGRFREDLYYRLAVVRLQVPPLRDRIEDVEPLARAFAEEVGLKDVPQSVIEQLKARGWPGNARELRNTVHAYAALGVLPEGTRSKTAMLDLALRELADPKAPYADQKDALIERFTAHYLQVLLEETGGNQTVAARLAGLDRGYLGRLVQKYGLKSRAG